MSKTAFIGVLAVAALAAGCAAHDSGPSRVAGPPGRMAEVQSMKIEVEADGLPSQLAPRNPVRGPDDPTQPWSPNYGTVPPGAAQPVARTAQEMPATVAAVPPPPSQGGPQSWTMPGPSSVVAMAPPSRRMHPDDIIRQAIADHEMRRQR